MGGFVRSRVERRRALAVAGAIADRCFTAYRLAVNPSKALTVLALLALSGGACTDGGFLTVAPIDCGRYAVSGATAGEGSTQAKRCIQDALETGAPAYVEQDIVSIGDGEPIEVRFDVLRKNEVRVVTGGDEQRCTGIADDGVILTGVGCDDLDEDG
jgi:hypothetical protein